MNEFYGGGWVICVMFRPCVGYTWYGVFVSMECVFRVVEFLMISLTSFMVICWVD